MTWREVMTRVTGRKDLLWVTVWIAGLVLLWIWAAAFLNPPAFVLVQQAFLNTLLGCSIAVVLTLLLGWGVGVTLYFVESREHRIPYLILTFLLNLLRSVPQIIGLLVGYIVLTVLIEREVIVSPVGVIVWMAAMVSLVTFPELVEVVRDRINHFRKTDFFHAMLCCGVRESRIVNYDILWKNSRAHILQKLIAVFGMAIFLQCSIDFIVSVGLSTDVSLSNFPATLGNLLATLDSKQDILAVSVLFTDPSYSVQLLTRHLQGISIAYLIVFSLICLHNISEGFVRRHRL